MWNDQSATSEIYVETVLKRTAASATMHRTESMSIAAQRSNFGQTCRRVLFNGTNPFQTHTAANTKRWRQDSFPGLWANGV